MTSQNNIKNKQNNTEGTDLEVGEGVSEPWLASLSLEVPGQQVKVAFQEGERTLNMSLQQGVHSSPAGNAKIHQMRVTVRIEWNQKILILAEIEGHQYHDNMHIKHSLEKSGEKLYAFLRSRLQLALSIANFQPPLPKTLDEVMQYQVYEN